MDVNGWVHRETGCRPDELLAQERSQRQVQPTEPYTRGAGRGPHRRRRPDRAPRLGALSRQSRSTPSSDRPTPAACTTWARTPVVMRCTMPFSQPTRRSPRLAMVGLTSQTQSLVPSGRLADDGDSPG
jgi:hypothetical protein